MGIYSVSECEAHEASGSGVVNYAKTGTYQPPFLKGRHSTHRDNRRKATADENSSIDRCAVAEFDAFALGNALNNLCQGDTPAFRRDGDNRFTHIASGREINLTALASMTPNRALLQFGRLAANTAEFALNLGMMFSYVPLGPGLAIAAIVHTFPTLFPSVIGQVQLGTARDDAKFLTDLPEVLLPLIPLRTLLGENPLNTWNRLGALGNNLEIDPNDPRNFNGRALMRSARSVMLLGLTMASVPQNPRINALIGQGDPGWWRFLQPAILDRRFDNQAALTQAVQRNYMLTLRERIFDGYLEAQLRISRHQQASQELTQLLAQLPLPQARDGGEITEADYLGQLREGNLTSAEQELLTSRWQSLGAEGKTTALGLSPATVRAGLLALTPPQADALSRILSILASAVDRAKLLGALGQTDAVALRAALPGLATRLRNPQEEADDRLLVQLLGEEFVGGWAMRELYAQPDLHLQEAIAQGTVPTYFNALPQAQCNLGTDFLPVSLEEESRRLENGGRLLLAQGASENATENRFELQTGSGQQARVVYFRFWDGYWFWNLDNSTAPYRRIGSEQATDLAALADQALWVRESLLLMQDNSDSGQNLGDRFLTSFRSDPAPEVPAPGLIQLTPTTTFFALTRTAEGYSLRLGDRTVEYANIGGIWLWRTSPAANQTSVWYLVNKFRFEPNIDFSATYHNRVAAALDAANRGAPNSDLSSTAVIITNWLGVLDMRAQSPLMFPSSPYDMGSNDF